jgi:indole-3-acetyl-L-aspartic acid hydrolase
MRGGVVVNTIAPEAFISIEYRGQTQEVSAYARKRVFEILDGAAKMHGMDYTYVDFGEIPAAQSDDAMMDIIRRAAAKVSWFEKIYFEGSIGGTDDASVMMNKVQEHGGIATYLGIGTDTTNTLHHPEFDLDEDSIPAAIEMLVHALEEIHSI